jgi:plastocyanin
MNSKSLIIGLIVVAIILVGGYFVWQWMTPSQMSDQQTTTQPVTDNNGQIQGSVTTTPGLNVQVNTGKTYDVVLSDSGFAPSDLTIKVGDKVNFKNESSTGMWVASAMHPTHTNYSGTTLQQHCPDSKNEAFDECGSAPKGSSWSFTFNKTGSWGYHNHVKASEFGKITVQQ